MKKSKVIVMGVALLMGGLVIVNAQEPKQQERKAPSGDEMMEMEANRMAEKLILDDATTAKFTPVYKKYLAEMQALREDGKGGCPKAKEGKKGDKQAAPQGKPEGKPQAAPQGKPEGKPEGQPQGKPGDKPGCAPQGCEAQQGCPMAQPRKTDAEVEAEIKARFATVRKMVDIQEAYYKEFSKFLSPKQIEKVLFAKCGKEMKGGKKGGMRPQGGMQPQGGQGCPQGGQPMMEQGCPQGGPAAPQGCQAPAQQPAK